MESQKYAIVDIETTGHSQASGDRMIQIAIVIMKDWCIEKTFTSFIHPGKSIPLFIQDLTNITDADVANALPFEAHAETIYEQLQDTVFVAHNTDFDLSFLQAEFQRVGLPKWYGKKIDTVELAKILYPAALSYKLGDLAMELNIPLNQAHRADDDAMACAYLLKKCWEELLQLPLATLEQMHKMSFRLKTNIAQLLFDALTIRRKQTRKDERLYYYKKIALKSPMQKKELSSSNINFPTTNQEKIAYFKQSMTNFEERPKQFQMMDVVWENLNEKSEVLIEASTGIGKTIGYLLPAIIYAKQHKRQVCISTYTTHLLEQLIQSEIPKIEKMLGCSVNISLLKGRKNYIDVATFEKLMRGNDLSYDETLTIIQVLVWLSQTETGDLSEINCSGGGQLFIDKIRLNHEINKNLEEIDFYGRAIRESANADLIITNHAMLVADLVRRDPIFNKIGGWVIDEAHQFVQAAVNRDQVVLTFTNWKYLFGQIGHLADNQLLTKFQKIALKKRKISLQSFHQLEKKYFRLIELFDQGMQDIAFQLRGKDQGHHRDPKQIAFINELAIDEIKFQNFSKGMQDWIDHAEQMSHQFKGNLEEIPAEHLLILEQWDYWIREYKLKVAQWDDLFLNRDENKAAWVEIDRRNVPGSLRIFKKPIDVATTVQQLFDPIRLNSSIVWTSGTLTVPNNERFIANQLGIGQDVPLEILQAEQSYYSGAKAYIVNDMPDIQGVSQSDYIESVALAITQIVRATEGKCFVLFTSQEMLRKTVDLIQESELLHDYMLFAQGVTSGSRMRLLKSFQKFSHSVLFGTNSFWEGVDVPGDGLSAVIVVRLPFSAPEEPTFKAKSIMLQQGGKNAFTELSLPEAILRFKQGFGRLIRSSQDKGVFIVLDRRIETKSYGVEFLRALPQISVNKQSLQNMVLEIEHWYNNKDEERKQVDIDEK